MKKSSYIVKSLSIRKMPGFPMGMRSLEGLAANVNIITGANASGKSSTARAIQELIWHNETKGLIVNGSVKIGEDNWGVDIDSGRIVVERNGLPDEIKGIPALEGHQRYLLALHNFVEGDEKDLAKEIAKQSIGGFDLDAAQENLGYSSRINIKSSKEYKSVEDVEKKYRDVLEQQKKLKKEEENLSSLKSKEEEARNAHKLNAFYNKVAAYLEVKLKFNQLSEQIKEFPSSMNKLTGKEYEQILEYESQIEECETEIEKAKDDIEKSKNELRKLTISLDGVEERIINEVESRLEKLAGLERNTLDYKEKIAQEKVKETTALNSIDRSIDPREWRSLNIQDVNGLDKMLRDAHQVLGEKQFLQSEIKNLEEEAKRFREESQSTDTFKHGIRILSEWLKEPIDNKNIPFKTVVFISLFGVISAVATYFIGWLGILFGLLLFVASFIYTNSTKGKESNLLSVREKDFNNSGLTPPSFWDIENVAHRLDELIESLKDCEEAERIKQRVALCKSKLDVLQSRMAILDSERKKWIEVLQAAPGFPEIHTHDFSTLYWFLTHVNNWQEANIQRVALETKLEITEEQYSVELEKINALFANSNLSAVNDVISAKETFNKLRTEEGVRKNHTQIVDQKKESILAQERLKQRAKEKLSEIYLTIEIEENDKSSVQEMINKLAGFKQISQEYYSANQAFLKEENLLQAHSLFNEYKEEIKILSVDVAKERASENGDIAVGLEDIQRQIAEVETLIQTKKRGHELEDLLSQKEEALDSLYQLYENNLTSITGDLIISELKKETQNENRPEVFKRANEIFGKITLGRYKLLLNEKEETNFRAFDTVSNRGYDLTELSTGTRVQLLLSVRLAYVETVESSIKLPLLADELLANSDDERARAIIEALIEISREGRQVFYFTAQADEVEKWQAHLNQPDLEHKTFHLKRDAHESHVFTPFEPSFSNFKLKYEMPHPNGKSHLEYGTIISVPPFNIVAQSSSELHLWYLMDEVEILYGCLTKGIESWGQLENYHKMNGQIENLDEATYNDLENRVELLKRFQELYQRGRSRPIDREVLIESKVISVAFIDAVSEKLGALSGDPKLLLQALRSGEISRFRADTADQLEHYFLTEGFIDDRETMNLEDILIRMHAFISSSEMGIEESEGFIRRILKRSDEKKNT